MLLEPMVVSAVDAAGLLPVLLDADEDEERILTTLLDPANTSYAAYLQEQLVGAAVVRWNKQEASEIIYMAVLVEQRGKGYGKAIIRALQAELSQQDGNELLVGTGNSSWSNLAFYQKCGFRMFEIRRNYFAYIQPPIFEDGIMLCDMVVLRYELV